MELEPTEEMKGKGKRGKRDKCWVSVELEPTDRGDEREGKRREEETNVGYQWNLDPQRR